MASPTFVAAYLARTPVSTSPATASVTTAVGDTLVCYGSTADQTCTLSTPTGGTSLTWTLQSSVVTVGGTDCSNCYMWTATATTAQTFTASVASHNSGTAYWFGFFILRFSGVAGFGAVNATHITATGTPTLSLTTTGTNSAIVVGDVDFVPASGTPAWLTNFGTFTQECDQYVASNMGQYGGYHANSGAPATKNVGMTAPTGQTYSIIALELLGQTASKPAADIYLLNIPMIRSGCF